MIERLLNRLNDAILILFPNGLVVIVMLLLKMVAALVRYTLEP